MKHKLSQKGTKSRGGRRITVDKDALVKAGDRLADNLIRICDTMAVTDELEEHYETIARLYPPIRRVLSKLKPYHKLQRFPSSGQGELPRPFRRAFANKKDEYLLRAARDSKSAMLITGDGSVLASSDRPECRAFYVKLGLRVLSADEYSGT